MQIFEEKELHELKELLSAPKNIVITTHHKPDGDAMGSSLALYHFLKAKGHDPVVVTPTDYPRFLHWMPGNERVVDFLREQNKAKDLTKNADLIFCVDFNKLHRINELGGFVGQSAAKKVLIDHHLEPDDFADFTFCNTLAAASAELVYDFIYLLNEEKYIDSNVATCLYTGLMTDTGSFRYESTTPKVHNAIADLIKRGANNWRIHEAIYDSNSENRLRFLGYCFLEKMVVLPEYNSAFISVSGEELKKFDINTGDTEGLVNYPLTLENIRLSALIIERPDMVKLSFRSKGDFSVNDLARKYFDGGGHKNAAGGKSDVSLEETVKKFIRILPNYKIFLNDKQY